MLKYAKEILTKVSFDARLFEKELRKAIRMLVHDELLELRRWAIDKFGNRYYLLINRCFQQAL
jgi:hypothetical protein